MAGSLPEEDKTRLALAPAAKPGAEMGVRLFSPWLLPGDGLGTNQWAGSVGR